MKSCDAKDAFGFDNPVFNRIDKRLVEDLNFKSIMKRRFVFKFRCQIDVDCFNNLSRW